MIWKKVKRMTHIREREKDKDIYIEIERASAQWGEEVSDLRYMLVVSMEW